MQWIYAPYSVVFTLRKESKKKEKEKEECNIIWIHECHLRQTINPKQKNVQTAFTHSVGWDCCDFCFSPNPLSNALIKNIENKTAANILFTKTWKILQLKTQYHISVLCIWINEQLKLDSNIFFFFFSGLWIPNYFCIYFLYCFHKRNSSSWIIISMFVNEICSNFIHSNEPIKMIWFLSCCSKMINVISISGWFNINIDSFWTFSQSFTCLVHLAADFYLLDSQKFGILMRWYWFCGILEISQMVRIRKFNRTKSVVFHVINSFILYLTNGK